MVHRQLTRRAIALAAILAGVAAAPLLLPGGALANNTRVSIADYQWEDENPKVDLGESVTWDWIGPDTMHSVTGQAPNATQWDSDPSTSMPQHDLGDSYTLTFDHPGQYTFVCKMHSSVRGTVTVSNIPGNPNSDPGPQDPLNLDLEAPNLSEHFLTRDGENPAPPVIGPKGKGITLRLATSESGTASVDYYRIVRKKVRKKGRKKFRKVRRYRGYNEWPVHLGINWVKFAGRSKTFKPKRGRYVAYLRVEDEVANTTPDYIIRFEIKGKKKKKHRGHRRR